MDDVCPNICINIKLITDLRNMARTCKHINKICKKLIKNKEKEYLKTYMRVDFKNNLVTYSIEKFTIEYILDGYGDLLDDKYYSVNNKMICPLFSFVGNVELYKYAISKLCPHSNYAISCAAYNGHVDMLNLLVCDMYDEEIFKKIAYNAALNNKPHIYDWLVSKNYVGLYDNYSLITGNNSIDIFKWLIDNNYDIDIHWIDNIINYDNVDMLKLYVHKKQKLFNPNNYVSNINGGSIKVLKYFKDNNFNFNYDEIKIENLKGDYADQLQWCYDNKIKFGNNLVKIVTQNCYYECVIWFHERKYEICIDDMFKRSAFFNTTSTKMDVIKLIEYFIHNNLLTYEATYKKSLNYNDSYVLEWILKKYTHNNNIIVLDEIKSHFYDTTKTLGILFDYGILDNSWLLKGDNYYNLLFLSKKIIKKVVMQPVTKRNHIEIYINKNNGFVTLYNSKNKDDTIRVNWKEHNNIQYDFLCDNKCWIYLYVMAINKKCKVKQYAKKNICMCAYHKSMF